MSLYKTLRVPRTATHHEITVSYKELVFQHHPNLNSGNNQRFVEITNAFRILKDKKLRYHYDIFGEKSLSYLNDNHVGEFVVNLYDRINLTMFCISSALLLVFLFTFPYLLLLNHPKILYGIIFSPFYLSIALLSIPFCRTYRFLRGKMHYKNEKRGFVSNSLKLFLLALQVFSITMYHDFGGRNKLVHLFPVLCLEGINFWETQFRGRDKEQWFTRSFLFASVHFSTGILLIYVIISNNVPFFFKCCIPCIYVPRMLLLKKVPVFDSLLLSIPAILLCIGVGCFMSKKYYVLGFCATAVFDILLGIVLIATLKVYRKASAHVFVDSHYPSLLNI